MQAVPVATSFLLVKWRLNRFEKLARVKPYHCLYLNN